MRRREVPLLGWLGAAADERRPAGRPAQCAEVRDFLLSPEGYDEVARQIGTDVTTDYIHGPLMDHLLSVAQRVVGDGQVPASDEVVEALIAVHAEGFESGLVVHGQVQ